MRRTLTVAVVLVAPAVLLMPLEYRIHKERAHLKYGGARMTQQVRDRIGQGMAIALLAGFRGVVADFAWIQSHGFWERREWMRQYRNMELVTALQPQSVMFWELGAWHMAWNTGYAVRTDPKNRNAAEGIKREREWQERARDFLSRGVANIPNRYELYFALGWLYVQKLNDPCNAAKYFGLAAGFQNTPPYVARMQARAMEKCGQLRAAYEYWKELSKQPEQAQSIIERELKRLEDQLNLPDTERLFPRQETPATKP
jgi:hypothetical protein